MKITTDFSRLHQAVAKLGQGEAVFHVELARTRRTEVDTLLQQGIEVSPEEIDFSTGIAAFQGRQVLLYIPDHSHGEKFSNALQNGSEGNKFHVTWCSVLQSMHNRNRFKRYTATNDLSGHFKIFGKADYLGKPQEGVADLAVCQTCLEKLNYQGARDRFQRKRIAADFSIPEFFETYSSFFKFMPSSFASRKPGYSENWKEISAMVKKEAGYTCQGCQINLRSHPYLVHVHHINGVKHDNSRSNLKVLCADCHRKEPLHDHMHVPREDMAIITRLRHELHPGRNADWSEVMAFADPAIHGVLDLTKSARWPMPEVGYEPQNEQGEVVGMLEAAWPDRKFGIVLVEQDKFTLPGWRLVTVEEMLTLNIHNLHLG